MIGVYMVYYDRSNNSLTEAYVEYIDDLQGIIDEYGDTVPIKIVGDYNVHLPKPGECINWFTSHSKLVHDFIIAPGITDQSKQVPVTYWNRQMNNKRYNKELDAALYEIPVYTQCPELDEHQTQTRIDGYMDCLRTYMIDAAKIRNTFDGRFYYYGSSTVLKNYTADVDSAGLAVFEISMEPGWNTQTLQLEAKFYDGSRTLRATKHIESFFTRDQNYLQVNMMGTSSRVKVSDLFTLSQMSH
ncbi:hypothetical protein LSH36_88g03006 [Paralvinella palmiformis]|uniref:Uncharacterized protein n=1 Tax=Paralvinella palmiformis TaxID=53620 RepID=A0AAD9K1E7_9ANNE|nr:hypothetical protein LSH36_88g03006 [Paralvinella palmiformis]